MERESMCLEKLWLWLQKFKISIMGKKTVQKLLPRILRIGVSIGGEGIAFNLSYKYECNKFYQLFK